MIKLSLCRRRSPDGTGAGICWLFVLGIVSLDIHFVEVYPAAYCLLVWLPVWAGGWVSWAGNFPPFLLASFLLLFSVGIFWLVRELIIEGLLVLSTYIVRCWLAEKIERTGIQFSKNNSLDISHPSINILHLFEFPEYSSMASVKIIMVSEQSY